MSNKDPEFGDLIRAGSKSQKSSAKPRTVEEKPIALSDLATASCDLKMKA